MSSLVYNVEIAVRQSRHDQIWQYDDDDDDNDIRYSIRAYN